MCAWVWTLCTGFGIPVWDVGSIIQCGHQAGCHWGQVWRTALLNKGIEARRPFCSLSQLWASQITVILLCFPSIKLWWWANCLKREFSVSLHGQTPDTTDRSSCRNTAPYSGLAENWGWNNFVSLMTSRSGHSVIRWQPHTPWRCSSVFPQLQKLCLLKVFNLCVEFKAHELLLYRKCTFPNGTKAFDDRNSENSEKGNLSLVLLQQT